MGIAEGIATLIAALATIGAKLAAGHITEAEAEAQSRQAMNDYGERLAATRSDDAKRHAETDAKLDAIDAAAPKSAPAVDKTGLLGDDGKPL